MGSTCKSAAFHLSLPLCCHPQVINRAEAPPHTCATAIRKACPERAAVTPCLLLRLVNPGPVAGSRPLLQGPRLPPPGAVRIGGNAASPGSPGAGDGCLCPAAARWAPALSRYRSEPVPRPQLRGSDRNRCSLDHHRRRKYASAGTLTGAYAHTRTHAYAHPDINFQITGS